MTAGVAHQPPVESRPASRLSRSYLLWTKAGVVAALIAALFWDVLADMAHDWWTEPALSQGLLIPPLALYIAWLYRRETFNISASTDVRGLLLCALACFLYIFGRLASEFFMTRISFVVLLTGLVWTFWGMKRLRTLAFPLLLLATMVPLPVLVYNSVAAPLQLFASDVAARTAQALGISVFRDGNIIQLANVSLGVAEACSGLNSLSALIVGSMLFGFLICSSPVSRILLVASAIPLAIIVNVLRVAGTAVLADYDEEFAMGFYHSFSGWLVFVAGAAVLYLLAKLLHAAIDSKA